MILQLTENDTDNLLLCPHSKNTFITLLHFPNQSIHIQPINILGQPLILGWFYLICFQLSHAVLIIFHLDQRWASLFCKESGNNYFRLCGPWGKIKHIIYVFIFKKKYKYPHSLIDKIQNAIIIEKKICLLTKRIILSEGIFCLISV